MTDPAGEGLCICQKLLGALPSERCLDGVPKIGVGFVRINQGTEKLFY